MKILLFLILSTFSFSADEEVIKELQQLHGDLKKAVQQIQERTKAIDGERLAQARTKVMELATDEHFLKSAEQLWTHPNRVNLLLAQLGFFIFMVFLKAWRQAKTINWFKKILVGFGFWLLTWIGLLVVLPLVFLGEPFRVFMFSLWRILFS